MNQDDSYIARGRLILFRHGETEFNKNKLMTGIMDVPLTPAGEEQAREAGRRLANMSIQRVYSSTLGRAFNTARLALDHACRKPSHLENDAGEWRIKQHHDLREIDTGDFTGRCHKTDPEILAWVRDFDRPLPGGESDAQAMARVQAFFEAEVLPHIARGETVMIVAHAGIVRVFDYVLGLAPVPLKGNAMGDFAKRRGVPNATPVVYDFENGKLVRETVLDGAPANQNKPPRKYKIG